MATTYRSWADDFKVDWPDGQFGDWKVERYTVGSGTDQIAQMGSLFSGGRSVPPGTYTRLMRRGSVIMSDTPDEIRDLVGLRRAMTEGASVLIAGLGLGCAVQGVLAKGASKVTVIEIERDVIDLVGPNFADDPRVEIIHADIFKWQPPKGATWDLGWYDIWPNLCTDNLDEMATLHRRFGRRTSWQGSWGKEYLQRQRRVKKRQAWAW